MLNRISVIGLLAAASLVFFTAGCRTNPQWDADNDRNDRNGRYVAGAEDDPGAGTAIAGPTEVPQPAGGSSWTDNPNELSNAGADADGWTPADPSGKRLNMPVIYFAYDSDVLVASEMRKVQGIAQYMAQNPQLALVLEGHCDQRGTEEYNRALGERRANAVRAALEENGVPAAKMKTQSFGEDKPAVPGSDASAWRRNRRCEPVPMILPR